jgi:hypothetical protein
MNPLARELNEVISRGNPAIEAMLSQVGRQLFFPKGILSQSAEAKEKAHRINATIGIAKEAGDTMCFGSVMDNLQGIRASGIIDVRPIFGLPACGSAGGRIFMPRTPPWPAKPSACRW